jgi:hypothetical protein
MEDKLHSDIPEEIRIVIEEIIEAYNEKRLVSVMTNNPTLTLNHDKSKQSQKKIVFQIILK